MHVYTIVLFLHIVGALGYFATIGVLIVGMSRLRRARTHAAIHEWATVSAKAERWLPASAALILLSGVYMVATVTVWRAAWIVTALGTLLVLAPVFPLVLGRYLEVLRDATGALDTGTAPPAVVIQVHNATPQIALRLVTAGSLGIVFLMTVKPDLTDSLIAIGVAFALSLVAGIPIPKGRHAIVPNAR